MEAKPWSMIEGVVTEYKINNSVWIHKQKSKGKLKQPYVVKWVKDNYVVGDMFLLSDFYKKYPKLDRDKQTRTATEKAISSMIADKMLQQLPNDNFKVLN